MIEKHPYFTKWTDPHSGVVSYILTERVAPLQKALYYITPSLSADGRWLWFRGVFPPSRVHTLAAVSLDPSQPRIRLFPQTSGTDGPMVTPEGDAAYVPVGSAVYRLSFDGEMREIVRLPAEILQNRHLFSLVTELTVSADGRYFVLDSHIGNRWLISLAEIATGKVTPLRWFGVCHHHAQFSPADPEWILVGQGPAHDPITGDKWDMNIRMWVLNTTLTRYEPVQHDLWFNRNCLSCHEWWSQDGLVCWVDYNDGVYECDLKDRKRKRVWKRPLCHAHCDATRRFYCGDDFPYHWNEEKPCSVYFFDRRAGRDIPIALHLPEPPIPREERRSYHLDPHPQISPDGRYVVYTTSALGRMDVAVTPVEGILKRMQSV